MSTNTVLVKFCGGCKTEKSLADYYRNCSMRDGVQPWCKPCHLASCARGRKANPENRKLVQKKYRANNGEVCKLSDAKWKAKDPERTMRLAAERAARWRKTHPETAQQVSILHQAKRRSAKRVMPFADEKRMRIVYKKAKAFGMHVDHIVPLNHPLVCGLHVWHNLQLLEGQLNRTKNNCFWPDQPGAN